MDSADPNIFVMVDFPYTVVDTYFSIFLQAVRLDWVWNCGQGQYGFKTECDLSYRRVCALHIGMADF